MNDIGYLCLAGFAALAVGILLGVITNESRNRRLRQPLIAENREMRARLADPPPSQPKSSSRWSPTEIAALIGAVGTLCGTLGTDYGSYHSTELTRLKTGMATLIKEKAAAVEAVSTVLPYSLSQWQLLKPEALPTPRRSGPALQAIVDYRDQKGLCTGKGLTLSYNGAGPAVLRCSAGLLQLQLRDATTVLLARAE